MQKLLIIGGAVCFFGALLAYSTGQGLVATFMLGFIGAVLVIVGLNGGRP